ncbi:MAG: glycoside hydrolase family 127 protein [Actinomyces sp.]|jgi:DUF1680 family protein|nr:beta-L-arabinofuranosidase domain-containing protein [Actinomyces sp.]MCI1663307.1 glycoside hydrolase family 127 protein [Actinomyces sp.]MCI1692189.1 glycoside hydrolase family 127 protein [Actinomyces sp.]
MSSSTSTPTARDAVIVDPAHGRLHPLGIGRVRIESGFWADRQRLNAEATQPHCLAWEQRVGWIDNFARTADGDIAGHRHGREFSDSDVYKLIEALAWEAGRTGDPETEAEILRLGALVEAAQCPDGYINTQYGHEGQAPRYSDLALGHELYCFGHLIQAAIARIRTGHGDEDAIVRVARRAADHVCREFGPGARDAVCGHPEIETGLAELARATGCPRYLEQARLFVDRRGHGTLPPIEYGPVYFQDDVPVRDAEVLRGHAVRALYLTAGAIDVAVERSDDELLEAARAQFDRALARRTYVTGGMGSHHQDEAFGEDFELPADRSYCETCAGVGAIMVAWRLLLATGDERYGDVIERTLYNVVATSMSEEGTAFFYANTLHQRTPTQQTAVDQPSPRAEAQLRAPWFEVSCCPTNVSRTLSSLAGLVATSTESGVQIHQFMTGTIHATLKGDHGADQEVEIRVDTAYPDDGRITVTIVRPPAGPMDLTVRIPEWAGGATVDGARVGPGARTVTRRFRAGESVTVDLAVAPRVLAADPRVDAVRGCVAVQRGPEVLCLESVDLPRGLSVEDIELSPSFRVIEDDRGPVLVGARAIPRLDGSWPYHEVATGSAGPRTPVGAPTGASGAALPGIRLIPYHAWANRGPSTMRVWMPVSRD